MSARGRIVNKLKMSRDLRNTEGGSKFEVLIKSAKVKAVARMEIENQFDKKREIWCCAEPVIDRMGRSGTSFLCVLGRLS